eukprot:TRINITY_DN6902_c0_g1_i1.p4 TRINITY_DN6902_c0_g1~~TRINITY_DN6902_c0_g1_i1.p4  ORF type:complete len:185 (-),score=-15.67 TRINITY_DN6902_c0_g1_i1:573-1127(-)
MVGNQKTNGRFICNMKSNKYFQLYKSLTQFVHIDFVPAFIKKLYAMLQTIVLLPIYLHTSTDSMYKITTLILKQTYCLISYTSKYNIQTFLHKQIKYWCIQKYIMHKNTQKNTATRQQIQNNASNYIVHIQFFFQYSEQTGPRVLCENNQGSSKDVKTSTTLTVVLVTRCKQGIFYNAYILHLL